MSHFVLHKAPARKNTPQNTKTKQKQKNTQLNTYALKVLVILHIERNGGELCLIYTVITYVNKNHVNGNTA